MNKLKIMYSILKEIEKGEQEPRHDDYDITFEEFGEIVDMMQKEGFIEGAGITRGGQGNPIRVVFIKGSRVTFKGLQYLEENSTWARTYRGLKEIREWIKL